MVKIKRKERGIVIMANNSFVLVFKNVDGVDYSIVDANFEVTETIYSDSLNIVLEEGNTLNVIPGNYSVYKDEEFVAIVLNDFVAEEQEYLENVTAIFEEPNVCNSLELVSVSFGKELPIELVKVDLLIDGKVTQEIVSYTVEIK